MGAKVSRHTSSILVVGLDNAGKSTIVQRLKPDREQSAIGTPPTVGFDASTFRYGSLQLRMYDMSGQGRYRSMWEHYYHGIHGVIFVIDSTDVERLCVVKDELMAMLNHPEMAKRDTPILFLCNKSDLSNSLDASEVSKLIEMHHISTRDVSIVKTNALTGEGLDTGIKWLTNHFTKRLHRRKRANQRM